MPASIILVPAALIVAGALGLVWGGDRLVRHAARLGRAARLSPVVIGTVVLGFGTSLPELFVSAAAMLGGRPGIALGNVVGSNIANVGLILGIAALMAPVGAAARFVRLDLPLAAAAGPVLLAAALGFGAITRVPALAMLAVFVFYLARNLRGGGEAEAEEAPVDGQPGWRILAVDGAWLTAGLIAVCVGAHLFVDGATGVASLLRVPSSLIGLTLVAVGTSLPELATTVAAARRGHSDLAFGNVLGSNVFNVYFILGSIGSVRAIPVPRDSLILDLPVVTAFALLAFPWRRRGIGRTQGLVLLAGYVAYVAALFLGGRTA